MSSDDRVIEDISRKIDREKVLIQGAKALRSSTTNILVQQKCDTNIHEGLKNIQYLEERLSQLQIRKRNSLIGDLNGSSYQNNADFSNPYNAQSVGGFSENKPGMFMVIVFISVTFTNLFYPLIFSF